MPKFLVVALAGLMILAACHSPEETRFTKGQDLSTPAPVPSAVKTLPPGDSDVKVGGELNLQTTANFKCFQSVDDFFIDGTLGFVGGGEVVLRINVEFYKDPGVYARRAQILIRNVEQTKTGISHYASWYFGHGTMKINADEESADLEHAIIPPEPGTDSTAPLEIEGKLACPKRDGG